MPIDGAKQQCVDAISALREIRRPPGALGSSSRLTVQGVIGIVNCTLSMQIINSLSETFVDSAAVYADELGLDGLNLDWEACPYYCDAHPIDCGTAGAKCKCSPAGFGTGVALTTVALGKKLLQKKRTVSLAIGVLKKGNDGQIVKPPYVYPEISQPGSKHPTSDITRLLKTSPFLERVTDMDTYYQTATDPELNHPHYFAQCVNASQQGFGEKLGVGLGECHAFYKVHHNLTIFTPVDTHTFACCPRRVPSAVSPPGNRQSQSTLDFGIPGSDRCARAGSLCHRLAPRCCMQNMRSWLPWADAACVVVAAAAPVEGGRRPEDR